MQAWETCCCADPGAVLVLLLCWPYCTAAPRSIAAVMQDVSAAAVLHAYKCKLGLLVSKPGGQCAREQQQNLQVRNTHIGQLQPNTTACMLYCMT